MDRWGISSCIIIVAVIIIITIIIIVIIVVVVVVVIIIIIVNNTFTSAQCEVEIPRYWSALRCANTVYGDLVRAVDA